MRKRTRVFLFLLCASGIAAVAPGTMDPRPSASQSSEQGVRRASRNRPPEAAGQQFDGRWWLSVSFDEQLGFYSGFDDCYTFDVKGPPPARQGLGWGPYDYVPAIGDYYRRHPRDQNLSLLEVIGRVERSGTPRPETRGGEAWKSPHGYYNLLWWWQAPEDTRKGYLEGYLWCYRTMIKTPAALFSKPLAEYIALVDKFVESHPRDPDEKLADILFRFRDVAVAPSKKPE